jgi:hypothetical protein
MPPGALALEESVVRLLGRGVALVVGTASEAGEPEICRAWGPAWNTESGELSVLVPLPAGQSSLDNLERAPAVAFTFSMPTDYHAYQIKGRCAAIRQPGAGDWRRARNHFDAFLAEAARVGLEPSTFAPWFPGEGQLVVAAIDAAFCQAPGVKAGLAL